MRPVGDSFASWRAIQAPLCISCVCPRPCTTRTSRDRVSIRLGTAVPCKRCCLRPAVRFLAPGVEAASLPERRTSSCYARRCRGFARAAPLTRDASIATKASGAHLRLRPCNLSRVRTSAPSSSPTSSEVWHLQTNRPNSAVLPAAHLPSHLAPLPISSLQPGCHPSPDWTPDCTSITRTQLVCLSYSRRASPEKRPRNRAPFSCAQCWPRPNSWMLGRRCCPPVSEVLPSHFAGWNWESLACFLPHRLYRAAPLKSPFPPADSHRAVGSRSIKHWALDARPASFQVSDFISACS